MAYLIQAGIQLSLGKTALGAVTTDPAQMVWYKITDHNREPISISTELIETQSRMANGKMRKYVIDQKDSISVSWSYVPSKTSETADLNYSADWLESFYNNNAGVPIYLKVVSSGIDPNTLTTEIEQTRNIGSIPSGTFVTAQYGFKSYAVFMNNFSKTIINRTKISDYVSMNIDFTEI